MRSPIVIMATYNGRRFIEEQFSSIAAQTVPQLDLIVSDDGSTDGTREWLATALAGWTKGRATLIEGPRAGNSSDNFRHLLLALPDDAETVALADQDDVWLPEKLDWAQAALAEVPTEVPAVACSRTRLIDEAGQPIGYSRYFRRPPSFRNAVVQSIAGGNTMVLNAAATRLVKESFRRVHVPAHDWWIYMIVTGAGGRMIYREQWDTLYRQHDNNVVGDNQGWGARLVRFRKLLGGEFKRWNDANEAALEACRDLLTGEGLEVLRLLRATRRGTVIERLHSIFQPQLFRQTIVGGIALKLAIMTNLFSFFLITIALSTFIGVFLSFH